MLCYRCEQRAKSIEAARRGDNYTTRHECGQHAASVSACYMFQPCHPVVTKPQDARPRLVGAMLSARETAVRVLTPEDDGILLTDVWRDGDAVALAWAKKRVDKRRSKRV